MHAGALGVQKQASDPPDLDLQMVVSHHCGCWELNPGPLLEQQVILPAEPYLQPKLNLFLLLVQSIIQSPLPNLPCTSSCFFVNLYVSAPTRHLHESSLP